ncbi:MAG: D-glycero-alpha-D-manno-heptose-1,7-bisphosphate 7-phosphatase [Thermoplasmata archaeon]
MIMRPALFTDRDGTINRDCPYCHDPSDLVIFDDAVDIIRDYRSRGYLIIVITNQSGIARGLFTVEEMKKFNDALLEKLRERGAGVDGIYFCPHHPDEKCSCRKPADGLVRQAMKDFDIDLKNSVILGDRDDIEGELARRLGIRSIILHR